MVRICERMDFTIEQCSVLFLQALTNQPITIYGDRKQTRSFCCISDTVTGLMSLMMSPQAKGEVVNVGNTQEATIFEAAKKVKEAAKCKSTIEFRPDKKAPSAQIN
jgi:UDP-glucuronate decarboxylase